MKSEKFRAKKEKFEKRAKKQLTDEEFEKWLRRERTLGLILWPICLVWGLLWAAEWPGPGLGSSTQFTIQFARYFGWALVVFSVVSLIQLARSWRIR